MIKNGLVVPADLSGFWVVTVLSNPVRYKRRYELYDMFRQMCEAAGVKLITVEQAFGNRQFMVTERGNPYHLQLRTVEELWHKENMINLGVKHACALATQLGLPPVREVAWVDADCRSTRLPHDWFHETWHQLQHYQFVQMMDNLIDLDPYSNAMGPAQPGFISDYLRLGAPDVKEFLKFKIEANRQYGTRGTLGRSGLAWAANIDAFNSVGGLIDYSILGAGDWYMAHALVGALETCTAEYAGGAYQKKMFQWQTLAERWIKRDVGFVPGTVYHDFHGKKALRFYGTRGKILHDNQYNPDTDIKYDSQGLLQLETYEPRQIRMRDQIRAYFRARNEDDISL